VTHIAVLGTLDTKAGEVARIVERLHENGWPTRVYDVGVDEKPEPLADVSAHAVAEAAGASLAALRSTGDRAAAMDAMGAGAARLLQADAPAAVIAVGGNQGTAVAARAMRELPIGLPKAILSTVASGDVRPYVGDTDIAMFFSVGDLLGGPNQVTAPELDNIAAAIAGMAASTTEAPRRPAVGLTAFGNTHRAAVRIIDGLRAAGREVVPFHASGSCGSAMERLIDAGQIDAVVELTTHELLGELFPWDAYAPVRPGRLEAAGRHGLPQVVLPGGLEYFCFGPPESIPAELRDRATHHHNAFNTNVRTSGDELRRVGALMAERLNASAGPVAVVIPLRGWSEVGGPEGRLHDLAANQALVDALRAHLRPSIEVREIDADINDPVVADAALELILRHAGAGAEQREELLRHGHNDADAHTLDPRDDARGGPVRAG
jgi:uncharacterized protein (UPF0261 family)